MNLLTLCQTGKYQTDKWYGYQFRHSYVENFYDLMFDSYQYTATEVLEIGIYEGESLRLWADYFIHANITGVELELPKNDPSLYCSRIRPIHNIDAYEPLKVSQYLSDRQYDIIIDDGPHDIDSQKKCIELYLPLLKNNGMIIIEDIRNGVESIAELTKSLPAGASLISGHVNLIAVDQWERNDSLLFWVKKS